MFRRASFVVPPPFFVILGPAFLVIIFCKILSPLEPGLKPSKHRKYFGALCARQLSLAVHRKVRLSTGAQKWPR